MKRSFFLIITVIAFFLFVGCGSENTEPITTEIITEPDISACDYAFSETYGESIPIQTIDITKSVALTNVNNFICPDEEHPLIVNDSIIRTHQVIFSFDAIYPVESIKIINYDGDDASKVMNVSIEISMDGYSFNRVVNNQPLTSEIQTIGLDNMMVKSFKLVFEDTDSPVGLQDIQAVLGEGYIIKEEVDLSNQFLRSSGWTGADGIFSFDLDQGGDRIGLTHQRTGFIFSDTFIGTVDEDYRRTSFEFVNNSFGYLENDLMSYQWDDTGDLPKSVLIPDAYIGSRARNLLDGDGLTITNQPSGLLTNVNEGVMWLSESTSPELTIDLKQNYDVSSIYLWNYNENSDYGVKAFNLYTSLDGINYSLLGAYQMDKASGNDLEPYTKALIYNQNQTRYIKIEVTESYHDIYTGLGKIQLYDVNGQKLFGDISASAEMTTLTENETTSRLWIQDGLVLNNKLYVFPILVKDYSTYFQVYNVSLVSMDIVDGKFDYQNAEYFNTPLMSKTSDGGIIYFGAGVMDNRHMDGYIYVYGYKDLDGRHLVASRVSEAGFLDFNQWEFFNGETWTKNIDDVAPLQSGVSAELSVTYSETGIFAGKYVLVAMENTTSGRVVYSLSDSPVGPFTSFKQIYQTSESQYLDAFTYNAKLHPNLSTPDKLIISYNVNSTGLAAFRDARIYYPRFISITAVKNKGE